MNLQSILYGSIYQGSGTTLLSTGCHLVFFFSFPILLLTSLQFLLGASLHHGVCDTIKHPESSDIFKELDRAVLTPTLAGLFPERSADAEDRTALQVIQACHANESLYNVLGIENLFNISALVPSQSTWNYSLPQNAEVNLEQLAKMDLQVYNFSQLSSLLEVEVTMVDIQKLVEKMQTFREQVGEGEEMVWLANQLDLEVEKLNNTVAVGEEMKMIARRLLDRLEPLHEGQTSLTSNLTSLIESTSEAKENLVNLAEAYMRRVEVSVKQDIGACAPVSEAFNATITTVCSEVHCM